MSGPSQIDYPHLVTSALRMVAARVLQEVAEHGLPNEHFFYLTIDTQVEGVEIPARLREQYPQELTIVLQNEFWDLYADDELFAVSLRFGGVAERLVVPWGALTAFTDPPAEFALQFALPRASPGTTDDSAEEPNGARPEPNLALATTTAAPLARVNREDDGSEAGDPEAASSEREGSEDANGDAVASTERSTPASTASDRGEDGDADPDTGSDGGTVVPFRPR